MANDYFTSKEQDKLDFKQICLGHYKKIMDISCSEFTGGYFNYVYSANTTNKSYITDKRKEFVQAVEILTNALFPHFDEKMREKYESFLEKEKEINKKYSDEDGFIKIDENKSKIKHSIEKLELMKDLFREISCLMYRLDYFKGATYHEGDYDELVDVDGRKEND